MHVKHLHRYRTLMNENGVYKGKFDFGLDLSPMTFDQSLIKVTEEKKPVKEFTLKLHHGDEELSSKQKY